MKYYIKVSVFDTSISALIKKLNTIYSEYRVVQIIQPYQSSPDYYFAIIEKEVIE